MVLARIEWKWFLKGQKTEVGRRKTEGRANLRFDPGNGEFLKKGNCSTKPNFQG